MKIWILNHYATDMFFEGTGRHHSFAKYLIKKGHEVKIFCANTVHNSDIIVDVRNEKYIEKIGLDNVPYVFVSARSYKGNGKDRVLNMLDYYKGVRKTLDKYKEKEGVPDIVIASSVHPLALVAGLKWSRKNNIKCICEVRDLWPESIVEFTKLTSKNIVVKLLYIMEKKIYVNADALIFTMEGGKQYIVDKKWDNKIDLNKVHHINNGVDLDVFNKNIKEHNFEDKNNIKNADINIVYAGSIRTANNVKNLAYIAKELKERKIENVNIIVYGDGPDKKDIDDFIANNALDNIYMMGKIDKKYIPSVLAKPNTISCLNYKYSNIFRYGGSQNKLFEYLASGNPVIANVRMGYDIIEKYNAGVVVGSNDLDTWVDSIEYLARLDNEEYNAICDNAKNAAKDYDYKYLVDKLISIIEDCL